jgi:tRNA-specific 2-thiouridylase
MQVKKVFVGLSGGVDSSVSALLLKRAGYDVVGVYIKGWQPDWIECTWKEERLSALRTAAYLDILFLTLDGEETYKTKVADYMIREYAAGRTPNGDMLCNREVKFGIFLKFALENGADYVATGHYAQIGALPLYKGELEGVEIETTSSNLSLQRRGVALLESTDSEKDQTYFLSQLTQKELQHILFPIGHLEKKEVRKLAEEAGLPVATRKDSQGICFVGDMSMEEWLKRELTTQKGNILNTKGEVVGQHEGAILYTIGQRHGLHFTDSAATKEPLYVVTKDILQNTVTVADRHTFPNLESDTLNISEISFTNKPLQVGEEMEVRLRYRGERLKATFISLKDDSLELQLQQKVLVAKGQFAVFYKDKECLGGGVMG